MVNALEGFTVIECSTFVTGPYAALLLAELGARVIKIESPPDGDPYRYFSSGDPFSSNFAHLNRSKESLVLDLKSDQGKKIALELVKQADVFVENFRPGAADRLGFGRQALTSRNQRLVYCSISGFGQTGPYVDQPGFDTLGQATAGLLSLLVDPDQPKVMGVALSDYITGLSAAYGILGALVAREKSGKGSLVETSLLQATLSFVGEAAAGYLRTGEAPDPLARVKNAQAFAFVGKDGAPFVIHCSVPEKFWLGLLKTVNRMDLGEDERFKDRGERIKNYQQLYQHLSPIFASRSRDHWLRRLAENDVPSAPLHSIKEALADPQVAHLGLVEEMNDPKLGKMGFVKLPVNYSELDQKASKPPPLLGEHTAAVLAELGYGEAQVSEMVTQGFAQLSPSGRTV